MHCMKKVEHVDVEEACFPASGFWSGFLEASPSLVDTSFVGRIAHREDPAILRLELQVARGKELGIRGLRQAFSSLLSRHALCIFAYIFCFTFVYKQQYKQRHIIACFLQLHTEVRSRFQISMPCSCRHESSVSLSSILDCSHLFKASHAIAAPFDIRFAVVYP